MQLTPSQAMNAHLTIEITKECQNLLINGNAIQKEIAKIAMSSLTKPINEALRPIRTEDAFRNPIEPVIPAHKGTAYGRFVDDFGKHALFINNRRNRRDIQTQADNLLSIYSVYEK